MLVARHPINVHCEDCRGITPHEARRPVSLWLLRCLRCDGAQSLEFEVLPEQVEVPLAGAAREKALADLKRSVSRDARRRRHRGLRPWKFSVQLLDGTPWRSRIEVRFRTCRDCGEVVARLVDDQSGVFTVSEIRTPCIAT